MISLIQNAAGLNIAEPLFACRINAVLKCYQDLNAADCFSGDGGAVFCRFSSLLLQSGQADAKELFEFASFLGINELQMLSCDAPKKLPCGWNQKSFPLLKATAESVGKSTVGKMTNDFRYHLRRAHEIIAASDEEFCRNSDPLLWISDLALRIKLEVGEAFLLNDAAAVCVSAKDKQTAYIAAVAVLPQMRGNGLGSAAVSSVVQKLVNEGKSVYISAAKAPLVEFYQKLGFLPLKQSLISIKKEN